MKDKKSKDELARRVMRGGVRLLGIISVIEKEFIYVRANGS
jgi:hypothetical protein